MCHVLSVQSHNFCVGQSGDASRSLHVCLLVANSADERGQTDRQKDRQTDRQTARQRDILTDRQILGLVETSKHSKNQSGM